MILWFYVSCGFRSCGGLSNRSHAEEGRPSLMLHDFFPTPPAWGLGTHRVEVSHRCPQADLDWASACPPPCANRNPSEKLKGPRLASLMEQKCWRTVEMCQTGNVTCSPSIYFLGGALDNLTAGCPILEVSTSSCFLSVFFIWDWIPGFFLVDWCVLPAAPN